MCSVTSILDADSPLCKGIRDDVIWSINFRKDVILDM
jgi:hypothetical protein